jgi:hypothetical protein
MNVNRSFSHPVDWECLDNLISKYPVAVQRSISSKIIRDAIEQFAKIKESKQESNLDDYGGAPRLDLEPKEWKKMLKEMNTPEVRELQTLMKKRKSLVDDEIFRRTL